MSKKKKQSQIDWEGRLVFLAAALQNVQSVMMNGATMHELINRSNLSVDEKTALIEDTTCHSFIRFCMIWDSQQRWIKNMISQEDPKLHGFLKKLYTENRNRSVHIRKKVMDAAVSYYGFKGDEYKIETGVLIPVEVADPKYETGPLPSAILEFADGSGKRFRRFDSPDVPIEFSSRGGFSDEENRIFAYIVKNIQQVIYRCMDKVKREISADVRNRLSPKEYDDKVFIVIHKDRPSIR